MYLTDIQFSKVFFDSEGNLRTGLSIFLKGVSGYQLNKEFILQEDPLRPGLYFARVPAGVYGVYVEDTLQEDISPIHVSATWESYGAAKTTLATQEGVDIFARSQVYLGALDTALERGGIGIVQTSGSFKALGQLISDIADGTAPIVVTSTTLVPNLNVTYHQGYTPSDYFPSGSIGSHGALAALDQDDHPQYHTDARALDWLGTRSSDDLGEGVEKLYFTDERARDGVVGFDTYVSGSYFRADTTKSMEQLDPDEVRVDIEAPKINVGAVEPSDPISGDIWLDTT